MDINLYKQSLKERGWTYRDLARETGISLTNISRIMAGIGINIYNISPEERAAGASLTRRVNVTPIEDDLLYAFRKLGKKHGEEMQRSIITMIEKML